MGEIRTLCDIYRLALGEPGPRPPFRARRDGIFRDVPAGEFDAAARELAAGLIALGLEPGDRVALLSESRLEWALADAAILRAGLASVPIYPSLTGEMVSHVLENSGARAFIASNPGQAAKGAERSGSLLGTAVFDPDGAPAGSGLEAWREAGRRLLAGDPSAVERRIAGVAPETLATIIYTSGTTGPPKGVLLTHGNIAWDVDAALRYIPLRGQECCLSFLPLSHIFERMAGLYAMLAARVTVAYAAGTDHVLDDLALVRPTVMMAVPRVYEKIYNRAADQASRGGPIRAALFAWARRVGSAHSEAVLAGKSPGPWPALRYRIADALVFSRIRRVLGGRVQFFVSGGAPLEREIAMFFHAARLPILEGYGLTETSPVLAVNKLETLRPGTVGKPLPGVEIRIAEDGEILARGPNVMQGYHRLPEATAEALAGGWFHTGDIGHLDPDGYLVITDRKKDLIVTSGGKNVAPQPIESRLKTDKYLSEAVILGDRRPYLVALIIPDFGMLERYAHYKGIAFRDWGELVRDPQIVEFLRRRVARLQEGAPSYETIKKIHVLDRELIMGEEMTPSLKVKRKAVATRFAGEIEALYGG